MEEQIGNVKTRGRPRKNCEKKIQKTPQFAENNDSSKKELNKEKEKEKEKKNFNLNIENNENKKNSINLHIPLLDTSDELPTNTDSNKEEDEYYSEKNQFTMGGDHDEKNKLVVYLSDDEELHNTNKKKLEKEIKKKDNIIKKLKEEISQSNQEGNISTKNKIQKSNPNCGSEIKLLDLNSKVKPGEKTNICCWHCTLQFDTLPCFIVEKYNNNIYYVFGCFCSYSCALAYILTDDETKIPTRMSLIKKLYSILYDTDDCLFPSQPKELLQKYGGPFTPQEYRDKMTKQDQNMLKLTLISQLQMGYYEDKCSNVIYK